MIFPEWSPLSILAYVLFGTLAIGMGASEHLNLSRMQYSKFRSASGIPSRVGMFWLYFIPFLAALALAAPYLSAPTFVQAVVLVALCGHFLKRTVETLFLHKYSGPMDLRTALSIGAFYTLVAGGLSYLNRWPIPAADGWFWLGVFLALVGQTGNYLHHKLLADQRGESLAYVVPRGGLFDYVVCPPYLFEIVAWTGMALLSRHLFAVIALLGMTGYLVARSLKTLAWYRQRFPDYPKGRKALIPFVL